MLCISNMSKMGKEHTHTLLLITFLNVIPMYVKDVEIDQIHLRAVMHYVMSKMSKMGKEHTHTLLSYLS